MTAAANLELESRAEMPIQRLARVIAILIVDAERWSAAVATGNRRRAS